MTKIHGPPCMECGGYCDPILVGWPPEDQEYICRNRQSTSSREEELERRVADLERLMARLEETIDSVNCFTDSLNGDLFDLRRRVIDLEEGGDR